jgi:hypothetical protein
MRTEISAGYGEFNVPLGSITETSFDETFNVNVRCCSRFRRRSRYAGRRLDTMTGSIAGAKGFPELSVYASKVAIPSFARTCTNDLRIGTSA